MPIVINPNAVPVYQTGPRHASIINWTCLCELRIRVVSFNSSYSYRQFWLPSPIHWLQMVGTITMHRKFSIMVLIHWRFNSMPVFILSGLALHIHLITILVKCGFVLCQFTDSSLNPLNSSPYFIPSVKIPSRWNSFFQMLHFFPGGILFPYFHFISSLRHSFSEWAFQYAVPSSLVLWVRLFNVTQWQ